MTAPLLALKPHEPVAERVLAPGDPGRALRLAQLLLDAPRMLNHRRGLWGYSGTARDGNPLTIQSTGIGGPSAALVVDELIALGARRIIRIGTAGRVPGGPGIGTVIAVESVVAQDGASRALGAAGTLESDAALVEALRSAADACGPIASVDLLEAPAPDVARRWREAGVLAVDLETAAVLAAAGRRRVAAGALVLVSRDGPQRLEGEALEVGEGRLGLAGLTGLG